MKVLHILGGVRAELVLLGGCPGRAAFRQSHGHLPGSKPQKPYRSNCGSWCSGQVAFIDYEDLEVATSFAQPSATVGFSGIR